MDLKQAIRARHAVRSYSRQPVDEQPWAFAIVQDRTQLERYSDRAKADFLATGGPSGAAAASARLLRDESFNVFYDAGALIVICTTEQNVYGEADCWLAAQNLMLAACDLGLGTCPIGFSVAILNTPQVKSELCIPERGSAVAPIVVGYPSGPAALATPRSAPRVLSWRR
jgi:nitroreductase